VNEGFVEPAIGGYVRFSGHLDVATVSNFESEAIGAAQSAEHVVVVDVTNLTFIDSAGLNLLADVLAIGTARGRAVALQGASSDLHKLLLRCGMESLFSYR
jgi:anti-anti-sigma factor